MKPTSRRRDFLKALPAGLAGAAALETLVRVRTGFAAALGSLPAEADAGAFRGLREQYTLDPAVTYFNHGAIGTIPRPVQEARRGYLAACEASPWLALGGGEWEGLRERTRAKAAELLGCRLEETAITHNTTEAFNLLASGLPLGPGDEVLFSSLNHPGASLPWDHQAAVRGYAVRRFEIPLASVPDLGPEPLLELHARQITPRTRVLVFPHVDNMVGLRHPVKELTALARARGVEIVAVDGAQCLGMLPVDVAEAGVDVYAASPHKWLQAPKGLGLLYVRRELQPRLRPMWVTWGQQRWKGSARVFEDYGTRNLPEVLALGDAIDFQGRLGAAAKERRYRELWDHCRRRVDGSPRLEWRSPTRWEMSASLYAVAIPGRRSEDVSASLSASHGFVFRAFGHEDFDAARLSLNVFNTEDEIDRFVDAVEGLDAGA
jgi:selenocysteine lyase/cysteine desulfurase